MHQPVLQRAALVHNQSIAFTHILVLHVWRELELPPQDVAADDHLVVAAVVRKGRVARHLQGGDRQVGMGQAGTW